MAAINNLNWNVHWDTRDCEVDGRYGYFHMWEQYSEVIPTGEVIAQVTGIVEFEDGVARVEPTKIKFTDQKHADLAMVNKFMKEVKEKDG